MNIRGPINKLLTYGVTAAARLPFSSTSSSLVAVVTLPRGRLSSAWSTCHTNLQCMVMSACHGGFNSDSTLCSSSDLCFTVHTLNCQDTGRQTQDCGLWRITICVGGLCFCIAEHVEKNIWELTDKQATADEWKTINREILVFPFRQLPPPTIGK